MIDWVIYEVFSIQFELNEHFRLNLQEHEKMRSGWGGARASSEGAGESRRKQKESMSEHRGSMSEHRGSMSEQRGSTWPKRALAREQSGEAWVSRRSRVGLGSGKLYIYIYNFPEARPTHDRWLTALLSH